MSASVSGMPGGQPSTTQPIAAPWLSPKVVTRNIWPNVLNDMDFHRLRSGGSPAAGRGQMAVTLGITHQVLAGEDVDHTLLDRVVRRLFGGCDAEIADQRPRRAAMGSHDRVAVERGVPLTNAARDLLIGLAAGRTKQPFVRLAPVHNRLVAPKHVQIGEPFPFAK